MESREVYIAGNLGDLQGGQYVLEVAAAMVTLLPHKLAGIINSITHAFIFLRLLICVLILFLLSVHHTRGCRRQYSTSPGYAVHR